ncbi:MAG: imidazole glycerol phosphate synthase subunit HisH [Bacteroidaceae bacterium]
MNVAILKYNAGNICSVVNAMKRLGIEPVITDHAEEIKKADRVLFPGQGEAATTMAYLRDYKLDKLLCELTQPVLGICIGQQLMCTHSEEGDVDCLGIFDATVKRFKPTLQEEKVPHMGWNNLVRYKGELLKELPENPFVYFIHSFYVPVTEQTIAITNYILPFSAAMHKDNFYATQFHPEKSGSIGETILQNFLDLTI